MPDRQTAIRTLAALRRTPVGDGGILVGSSALFGFETQTPALTEDIHVVVPVEVAQQSGPEIVAQLEEQGYAHAEGGSTFLAPDGESFDLLGAGAVQDGDYIAGDGPLRVMVFEDLSRTVSVPGAVQPLDGGGSASVRPPSSR